MYYVVTGAAGFIGSNIVKALNERGITNIIAVDNLTKADKFKNLIDCEIADYLDKHDFIERIQAGLMTPTLCVSHGGELAELRALPGYARLRETCAANNIELFESVMSLTGMVNVGKGAVVVGFAAPPHRFG